jgi:hypothetical protein
MTGLFFCPVVFGYPEHRRQEKTPQWMSAISSESAARSYLCFEI